MNKSNKTNGKLPPEEKHHEGLTYGIIFGMLLGTVIDIVTEIDIGVSFGIGLCLGLSAGCVYDSQVQKNTSNGDQDT